MSKKPPSTPEDRPRRSQPSIKLYLIKGGKFEQGGSHPGEPNPPQIESRAQYRLPESQQSVFENGSALDMLREIQNLDIPMNGGCLGGGRMPRL